jgi:hypothetical protein
MSEHEMMMAQLGQALQEIARPYSCDAPLPGAVQANLWRLGVRCDEQTPREQLVALLWARKRSLSLADQPIWGGPETRPPNHAA